MSPLKGRTSIVKWTSFSVGSQCSCLCTGLMWSNFFVCVRRRAAAFKTRCKFCISYRYTKNRCIIEVNHRCYKGMYKHLRSVEGQKPPNLCYVLQMEEWPSTYIIYVWRHCFIQDGTNILICICIYINCRVGTIEGPGQNLGALHSSDDRWRSRHHLNVQVDSLRYDANQSSALPRIPKPDDIHWSSIRWSTLSKASDRSNSSRTTQELCPIPRRHLSEHEQVQSHNYDVDDMQIEGVH